MHLQWAVAEARGVDAALSSQPLALDWFDAACPLEEQAADLRDRTNALRSEQRAKAKLGWPGW